MAVFLPMLGWLLFAHFIADYPLQGDFLSRAKNRTAPIQGFPWWHALGAHAFIHAGFVAYVTSNWWLGLAEFAIHAVTDDAKCRGKLSLNQDQAVHVACKIAWALIAMRLAT